MSNRSANGPIDHVKEPIVNAPNSDFPHELLRETVGAGKTDHDRNARLSSLRCKIGRFGGVVRRGFLGKDGYATANACPNDAREPIGRHDDDDTVEGDRVKHPLRVIERCPGPESRRGRFGPVEVLCAGRGERHSRAREVRQDGGQRVDANADRSDLHRLNVPVGHCFS
jgi:hypothetical protein